MNEPSIAAVYSNTYATCATAQVATAPKRVATWGRRSHGDEYVEACVVEPFVDLEHRVERCVTLTC
eukprot:6172428-Pleurochrysis_carterae.AAC.4